MRPGSYSLPLSPDERFREVARLLAAGLLRRQTQAQSPADPDTRAIPKNLPESAPAGLEVPAETRLSVQGG